MRTTIYVAVETGRRWAVCPHDMPTGETKTEEPVLTGLPTYAEALRAAQQKNRSLRQRDPDGVYCGTHPS